MSTTNLRTGTTEIAAPGRNATERHHDGAGRADGRVTLGRVVLSELVKLRSVRSTVVTLVLAVASIVGFGVVFAVGAMLQGGPVGTPATADPTGGSQTGVALAVYLVAGLGVVAVTGEYGTGTIRTSLAAVPRRATLVLGKTIALGLVTLAVTLPSTLAAFLAAKALLSTVDMSISLGEPGVARVVVGAALYLTVVAVLSSGLGWLLRNTAGALTLFFGVMAVLPVLGFLLPRRAGELLLPYLPGNAGTAIMQLTPGGQLPPWTGFAVFCGYAAVTLLAAVALVRRRDT